VSHVSVTPSPKTAPQIAAIIVPFVEQNYGVTLHFSPISLRQLDAIIDDLRRDQQFEEVQPLLFSAGCYLGEVFVRHARAVWRRPSELRMGGVISAPIVLQLRDGRGCNPVAQAYRRFQNGPADSLEAFYTVNVDAPGVALPVAK
jgi:hypothetical protein